jgi:hypothetical protein
VPKLPPEESEHIKAFSADPFITAPQIRCSSEKTGCTRCKTLSKPCVYVQRGEGKRPSRKRDESVNQGASDTDSSASVKRRATQWDKSASADAHSRALESPQAKSASMKVLRREVAPLLAWSTPGCVTDDLGPLGEDDDEADGSQRETTMPSLESWLTEAPDGLNSPFRTALFSPLWPATEPGQHSGRTLGPTAPFSAADTPVGVSPLLSSLPTAGLRESSSLPSPPTTSNHVCPTQPPLSETGQDKSGQCLCLQHVAFLVHELESTQAKHLDAGLCMHKEAVSFAESMLQCPRCSRRPENLTLLTFLSERLLRLGGRLIRM